MAEDLRGRVVHGACPHDCPDTCAMLVHVDEYGRATKVEGNPDQPVTAGFLCGKVSDYPARVYAEERLRHPLVRIGPKGSGSFKRVTWDEALDRVAAGLQDAIDRHGAESILPYSYFGTQGFVQSDLMSARVMNALGASELERTVCATAGLAGTVGAHGVSPEVDPELWPRARYLLVWGWNPMSTAPHLWRFLLEARRAGAKLVVVDPARSRTARVADLHLRPLPGSDGALAMGMMRAAVDAGLADEAWCREHADGYDDLLERLHERTVEGWAELCGVPAEEVALVGREFATTDPALLRLGVGAQRHLGAPAAYTTAACLPALTGAWRHPGGGCSYVPTATAGAVSSLVAKREDLRPGPVRKINMSQLGTALTDPAMDPPVSALVVWSSNPAQIAPEQGQVLEGLRREDLFCTVLDHFMTDTAAHADVVLPATTQLEHTDALFSWGHHYLTYNEAAIEPVGEAKPNSEVFRLLAARLGLDDPCFRDSDEDMLAQLFASDPGGVSLDQLRSHGFAKVDLGQGEAPHADGGFGTQSRKVALGAARYEPSAEVADAELAERLPLALISPKTHLFLNSTFAHASSRQRRRQPAPFLVLHPDDAAARQVEDGDRVRAYNDRGAFTCSVKVSDDARPGVAVAPMGWWKQDQDGGVGAQATTSQRLTELGAAPIFNDNRVEVEKASE